jgi:hypothetical protein
MDKETLSNYGWIVIAVLVLVVMIALATPFGSFISEAVQSTTKGLFDVNKSALDSTGLINIDNQEFDVPDMNHGAENGGNAGETPATLHNVNINFSTSTYNMSNLVLYSTDGGNTWTDISNILPDNLQTHKTYNLSIECTQIMFDIRYMNGPGYAFICDELGINWGCLMANQITDNLVLSNDIDVKIGFNHLGGAE